MKIKGLNYESWSQNETRFRAMTGLNLADFAELLIYFEEEHYFYLSEYKLNGKKRLSNRKYTIKKNSSLPSVAERLVFILSYLKLNPIQEQQAVLFSMTQAEVHHFFYGLNTILTLTLEKYNVCPSENQTKLTEKLEKLRDNSEKILIHDATEREIPRPIDDEIQQENYSGKKKKHTVKNAIICTASCLIIFLSPTYQGKMHDKKIADTYTISFGFELWQDNGYQGYNPVGVTVIQPQKKPKGKDLTQEMKDKNREISRFRVRVEHAIGSVKRLKIVRDECRLRKENIHHKVMKVAVALHNFRITINPFNYKF